MQPRCSVVSCTFNGEIYLRSMLDSLLSQTFQDFDVVIVDDASTDQSKEILVDYAERFGGRLCAIFNATNQGPGYACSRALAHSTGEFVAFLAQDDFYEPDFLRTNIAALDADPASVASFGAVRVVNDAGQETGSRYYLDSHAQHANLPPAELFPLLLGRNLFHMLGAVMRRAPDILQSLGFRNDTMNDWELCLNLLLDGRFRHTPEAVACYRVHAGNISGNSTSGRTRFARQYTFDRDQMLRRVLMGEKFAKFVSALPDAEGFLFECTRNLRADASLPSPLQRVFFAEWLEHVHHRVLIPEGTRLQSELMEGLEAIGLYSRSYRLGGGALRKRVPVALWEWAPDAMVQQIEHESPNFEIRRVGSDEVAAAKLHEMVWVSADAANAAALERLKIDPARFWVVFLSGWEGALPDGLANALVVTEPASRLDGRILLYYEDFVRTHGAGLAWRERQSWLNALTPDRLI